MSFRYVRLIVLLGACILGIGALVAGTRLCLPPFWSNVVAGVVGSATTIGVGLLILERYEAARWKPASDAALSAAGLQIGLLIHWLHFAIDNTQYTSYGVWIEGLERGDVAVADALEQRAEAINRTLRDTETDRDKRHSLLQNLLKWLDIARIDRIRSLAFPLLAGTVDPKAVAALTAIERAMQFSYFAKEMLGAFVAEEPAPNTDEREVVREMLRRLVEAYRRIVAARSLPE